MIKVPEPVWVRDPGPEINPVNVKLLPLVLIVPFVVKVIGLERERPETPDTRVLPLLVLKVKVPVPRAVLFPGVRKPCWKIMPPVKPPLAWDRSRFPVL